MIINRDNSVERSATASGLYRLISILEAGTPYALAVLRAEFPNVVATEVVSNNLPLGSHAPSPRAVTGAGSAVNLAISDEQRAQAARARLEDEAQLKIEGAYATPGPIMAAADSYPPHLGRTATELSPEQTQFIGESQLRVERAFDEPLA